MSTELRGLYAITDSSLDTGDLSIQVDAAITGGARVIQYRDKTSSAQQRIGEARVLRDLCRARHIPLIINDDIELALAVDADGVHLGRDDGDLASARTRLGPGRLLGISCYNDLRLAQQAAAGGADYVAFGSFYASATKPLAVRADIALLQRARAELQLPVVAIGGITPENGRALIDAGADMLAVIRGVFAAADICRAAQAFSDLFEPAQETH